MPLQIANPTVVDKVEQLARLTGLNKTAAVERAVDALMQALSQPQSTGAAPAQRLGALLAQLDRIPDRPDAHDPLVWDEHGLPA
ncbi:type II toxin-antitoxin system VapB family antitoxin [Sphaerotilus microaerophilus]|jgi:antitoxin VapB|uniref:Antitoxin VapB n=1 Tax=Sphaerotilus microaerophilus TaxID=2914710 RepID=A0ABN6PW47_9BURK|nr:type II toxin-antitoxin system VapB family antitoxin [Sphaerotilus sp. FB-5]BDI07346.1 hypothetical protein CATMQ487_43160 [Sphaerotilus sp. FB-5]